MLVIYLPSLARPSRVNNTFPDLTSYSGKITGQVRHENEYIQQWKQW